MKRNSFFLTFIFVVISSCFSSCSNTPSKEDTSVNKENTYVIKVGHAAAKEHLAQKSFEKFKELVEKIVMGKLKWKFIRMVNWAAKEKCLKSFSLVI